MTIFQSIILGIVQGLTELLPISSSAHLYLIPEFLNWTIPEYFDVALHFGTLLAICIFFFKDWLKLIAGGFKVAVNKFSKNKAEEKSVDGRMFWYLVLATIPGGIIGYILDKYAKELLTNTLVISIALIVMGIILYVVDKFSKSETTYEDMTLKQTFLVGLSQALAFIPGVSRSGVTMTTARLMGVDRTSAAKYSFMLSAPIVLGAVIFKLSDFVINMQFILGVLSSFIVGILVIKFLLDYLRKGDFKWFAIYRVILGIASIVLLVI